MKQKEKQQIALLSKAELTSQLSDLKKQIKAIELEKFTKPMKNVRAISALRLKVALIQTRLHDEAVGEVVKEK